MVGQIILFKKYFFHGFDVQRGKKGRQRGEREKGEKKTTRRKIKVWGTKKGNGKKKKRLFVNVREDFQIGHGKNFMFY